MYYVNIENLPWHFFTQIYDLISQCYLWIRIVNSAHWSNIIRPLINGEYFYCFKEQSFIRTRTKLSIRTLVKILKCCHTEKVLNWSDLKQNIYKNSLYMYIYYLLIFLFITPTVDENIISALKIQNNFCCTAILLFYYYNSNIGVFNFVPFIVIALPTLR